MGRPMDWTMKDSMDNGLFLCATLTNRRRGQYRICEARAETYDTLFVGRAIPGEWVPMSGMKV